MSPYAPTALFVTLAACQGKDEGEDTGPPPTYAQDVAPILAANCTSCHVAGGIAPFALDNYADAALYADWSADAVVRRQMPPGQAAPGCNEYVSDPALSDEDIQTLERWADDGAPEGDTADPAELLPPEDSLALSRIDYRLTMPEPYTPTLGPDDYRCFLLDWPESEELYVTGIGMAPGEASIVHHVIIFMAEEDEAPFYDALDEAEEGPGYTCFGGPGGDLSTPPVWLGAWVPGVEGRDLPEGTGIPVTPGSRLIMQVHYNIENEDAPRADQSTVLLKVDESVEHEASMFNALDLDWVLRGDMPIPAGEEGVTYSASRPVLSDSWLHEGGLHMHTMGQGGSLTVSHGDGSESCVLNMDRWDFNWQRSFRLAEPIHLSVGDTLNVTCVFDNNTDEDANWGEGTGDEMCLGISYASVSD